MPLDTVESSAHVCEEQELLWSFGELYFIGNVLLHFGVCFLHDSYDIVDVLDRRASSYKSSLMFADRVLGLDFLFQFLQYAYLEQFGENG